MREGRGVYLRDVTVTGEGFAKVQQLGARGLVHYFEGIGCLRWGAYKRLHHKGSRANY
jgi:hypothetical protein